MSESSFRIPRKLQKSPLDSSPKMPLSADAWTKVILDLLAVSSPERMMFRTVR